MSCSLQGSQILQKHRPAQTCGIVANFDWLSTNDDRLPKKLLSGQVKGHSPLGCHRISLNDVAVRDCHLRRITKPYKDAQKRLLWRDKTCLTRT